MEHSDPAGGRLTTLLTPWGEALDPDHPLPHYPRPQLRRDSYLNLNGRWDYAITADHEPPSGFDGTIVVPFSPEAPLSGVGRQLQPDQVLHYRRSVTLPDGFAAPGDRVVLHFGAVDQSCRVLVNGVVVAEHVGGYLPFSVDVTDTLTGADDELRVAVTDPSDTGALSRGKQKLHAGGIWYTAQSGIWQTVWVEAVPATRVQRLVVVPVLAAGPAPGEAADGARPSPGEPLVPGEASAGDAVVVTVRVTGPRLPDEQVRVTVTGDGREIATVAGQRDTELRVAIPNARRWTPDDPFRYDLRVTVGADEVRSRFGMRTVAVGPDTDGVPRLLLNGAPYFHAGVLDQGYWPDGLYTAPSDEAMVFDIATMKRLGFNLLRKHIKVEPLRWYDHCDRLGMLVWQDLVNGGERYHAPVVVAPVVVPLRLSDRRRRAFARRDTPARVAWLQEARATVELLRNVTCIAVWVPFNEGWGQFDATAVAEQLRALDPTRVIDHASGWHDQGGGDLTSRHVYFRRFRVPRRRAATAHRALVLSEYGGYSQRLPDHSATTREFGYRRFTSADALAEAFADLHAEQIVPAIPQGLAATVYTQLSDVEDETNGLLTYDRRVLKISEDVVRAVTAALRR